MQLFVNSTQERSVLVAYFLRFKVCYFGKPMMYGMEKLQVKKK